MKRINVLVMMVLVIGLAWLVSGNTGPFYNDVKMVPVSEGVKNVPVKGMVTMVDLGAASCIPCKMMAPILDKLEKRYQEKAAVVFIDLRYNEEAAQQFSVQSIPTQIFFDAKGREISRHIGFMSEEAIVAQFKSMGVQ